MARPYLPMVELNVSDLAYVFRLADTVRAAPKIRIHGGGA
jgi:hypothetical protein